MLSDTRQKVQSWYEWHLARRARAADIEGLNIDSDRFLKWLLDPGNIATRSAASDKHQKAPMRGRHVSRGGILKHIRGSDLSERVFVGVRVLELKGLSSKAAYIEVATALEWKRNRGKTKRGRPSAGGGHDDPLAQANTVRSLAHKYRAFDGSYPYLKSRGELMPDTLVCNYVASFLNFEDWLEATRPLLDTAEGHGTYEKILGPGYIGKFLPSRK